MYKSKNVYAHGKSLIIFYLRQRLKMLNSVILKTLVKYDEKSIHNTLYQYDGVSFTTGNDYKEKYWRKPVTLHDFSYRNNIDTCPTITSKEIKFFVSCRP